MENGSKYLERRFIGGTEPYRIVTATHKEAEKAIKSPINKTADSRLLVIVISQHPSINMLYFHTYGKSAQEKKGSFCHY
jgi:hypothetical protein